MNKKDFIKITNPNQFEIKTRYLSTKNKKKIDYKINVYIFIPKNLAVNEETYTKDNFYNDQISYIRFITPHHTLGVLSKKMQAVIIALKDNIDNKEKKVILSHQFKILVCSYVTFFNGFTKHIEGRDIKIKRIQVLLARIEKFDNIKKEILSLRENCDDNEFIDLVEFSSEYISNIIQNNLLKINIYLKKFDLIHTELIRNILLLINKELTFCKDNGFPIISTNDYENERVIYRNSVFKKYFYSVLYLQTKRKDARSGITEFYYAIAAGISMIFTTTIIFATQKQYGNFTTSFFAALVVSYMFKDRLKEAYRKYFDKKIQLKTYDYKEKIYNSSKKSFFAIIKEKMNFIKKENLDSKIIETRLKKTANRLSTWFLGEDIIKYEKCITLYKNDIYNYYDNAISGIYNIMRFDITKLLKKMDNTKVPLYRVSGHNLYGDKVYHINVVIEFNSKEENYRHKARLILTKKGIKRIEVPEYDMKFFAKNKSNNNKNWFSLKKSGLIKKN